MSSDPNPFDGTAHYYALYRPVYPPELIAYLRDRFNLDGSGRLLDLGCGTGQLAIPLAPFFEETVAMDPDPNMLAEGRRLASAGAQTSIRWVLGGSADLEAVRASLTPLRLVTMGASFHWMDRSAILNTLATLMKPGGGLAIVSDSAARQSAAGLNDWWELCLEHVREWLGPQRRAGSGTYRSPDEPHEAILARSPFSQIETWSTEFERERELDDIVGLLFSTSYASPAVLGARKDAFEQALRRKLSALRPGGRFRERVQVEAILVWLS